MASDSVEPLDGGIMTNTENDRYRINQEEVVWRPAADRDELVVLELSTSTYLTLNGTGKVLWEALADGSTPDALADLLVDQFGIDRTEAGADVATFLAELGERGLVVTGD